MSNALNIISANDLRSGLNVYFTQEGGTARWDTDISRASVYDEDNIAPALARAKEDLGNNIIVDCVTVPVDGNHQPFTIREKIRAAGPSVKYGK